MKIDVFGREIAVIEHGGEWKVFYCSSEGKKRIADDIVIPAEINESELANYLSDICHEYAQQNIRKLEFWANRLGGILLREPGFTSSPSTKTPSIETWSHYPFRMKGAK